ncbi:MAG TPA: pseudouridine synthase [Streptosporangiaceae bacterium]|jgi:pseudouridine synthase|nr:pseudouridine synthase [Streptosporangiaceae bacterium]
MNAHGRDMRRSSAGRTGRGPRRLAGGHAPASHAAGRPVSFPADLPEIPDEDFADDLGADRDSLTDVPGGVRLQKVLAAAGVGSRRHCEELIGAGRVEVDGETVRRFGARVDPERQVIRVDGKRIPSRQDLVYLAFNKPPGVLTAMSDPQGRPTVTDFLGDRAERLFHVGRLDYDTEGLMLLTNDGELAHRLAHPRYGVLKTYLAEVQGPVPKDLGRKLMTGIELADGVASADRFRVLERAGSRVLLEITLHEGRKRIVRRMLAETGYPVIRLVRTDVGPVRLGGLKPGTMRNLTTTEVGELYASVGL